MADTSCDGSINRALHLHRFQSQQLISPFNFLVELNEDTGNDARGGGADMTGFGGIDFRVGWSRGSESFIANHHFPGLPVQFEEDSPIPVGMGFSYREIFDHQGFSWLQIHGDFLS